MYTSRKNVLDAEFQSLIGRLQTAETNARCKGLSASFQSLIGRLPTIMLMLSPSPTLTPFQSLIGRLQTYQEKGTGLSLGTRFNPS